MSHDLPIQPATPGLPVTATTITVGEMDVLRSLIIVHRRDRRATVRSVAEHAGRPVTTVYARLRKLRRLDLVAWDGHRSASLRPLVKIVGAEYR